MAVKRGLTRRLGRDLLLQAGYISLAVLVGLFAALRLMEDVVVKEALLGEAEYYWQQEQLHPGWALPDTKNLTGFREDGGSIVPADLLGLAPGYHRRQYPVETLTYITEHEGKRLYLVFEVAQVGKLVTVFGIIPLAFTLIIIYLSLYIAYRVSSRAVSPIVNLARRVQRLDPANPDVSTLTLDREPGADTEIHILSEALEGLVERAVSFAERERRFTRDASHELRTPLTVIKIATDRLMKMQTWSDKQQDDLLRIRNSVKDMEQLTHAFLLLARETKTGLDYEWLCVNEIVELELERLRIIQPDSLITLEIESSCRLLVEAPTKVLESIIGNLLRNAFTYTDAGIVTINISSTTITIEDTGPGMDQGEVEEIFKPFIRMQRQRGGFGVGLTIVKRLTDRFEWPVSVKSEPGKGTRVSVEFPRARNEPIAET